MTFIIDVLLNNPEKFACNPETGNWETIILSFSKSCDRQPETVRKHSCYPRQPLFTKTHIINHQKLPALFTFTNYGQQQFLKTQSHEEECH